MKIGIVRESEVDEAAIRIFVESIAGTSVEILQSVRPRAGGFGSALDVIKAEYLRLHYHPDADGLVIIIDSDDTPLHVATTPLNSVCDPRCRLCLINQKIAQASARLAARPDGRLLPVAVGMAVPALEAWLLCGRDPHAAESNYRRMLEGGLQLKQIRDRLKTEVYGSARAPMRKMAEISSNEAMRLRESPELLERLFPIGFGMFASQIRTSFRSRE